MNILQVVNGWPSGGILEQTYLLCKHLPKDEFKQFSLGYCYFGGEFFKKFEDVGVPCIKSDEDYSDLVKILTDNKIDIVHKQTGGGDCPDWVYVVKECGVKLIETVHCPRASGIPVNFVDAIAYTTPYTLYKNDYDHKKIMYSISYALDLKQPIRNQAKDSNIPLVVGRLGRIVPDKRQDTVLAIAKMCLNDPDMKDKVKFKLAGTIPQDCEYHINNGKWFVNEVKYLPNVEYVGFVENKYSFWRQLDICINPVCEASFDIVFLEAMACGIPILTWDNSAAKYVVKGAGIITEESVESLYEGLIKLVNDEELRHHFARKGLGYIMNEYSLDSYISNWTDLYNKVYYA